MGKRIVCGTLVKVFFDGLGTMKDWGMARLLKQYAKRSAQEVVQWIDH